MEEEEKYSNFTKGYAEAIVLVYGGLGFGLFSLYKFGQGDKKYLQIFAGVAVTLFGAARLKSLKK